MQDIKTIIVRNELKAYVMEKRAEQRELEERYNHYHDPRNGRFASGKGGGSLYVPQGGKGLYSNLQSKYGLTKGQAADVMNALGEDIARAKKYNNNNYIGTGTNGVTYKLSQKSKAEMETARAEWYQAHDSLKHSYGTGMTRKERSVLKQKERETYEAYSKAERHHYDIANLGDHVAAAFDPSNRDRDFLRKGLGLKPL